MRKLMLATTALLGCGMVMGAAPANALDEVTMGGEYVTRLGFFDYDNVAGLTDSNTRDMRNDIELHFGVEGTTDTGLVYGGHTELNNSGSNLVVDEAYMYLSGSFGMVQLGDEDGVVDGMRVLAPSVGFEMGVADGPFQFLNGEIGTLVQTSNTGDSTKINYFSPNYQGLQLGLSWTPEAGNNGTMVSFDETQSTMDDMFEVALRYDVEYEEFAMRFMGSYSFGDADNSGLEDVSSWMIGMDVTYASFTFGGAYVDNSDSGLVAGAEDQTEWQLGISYENGPFGVAFNYVDTESYKSLGYADQSLYGVMASYKVAEGLEVGGHVYVFDQDFEAAGIENDGYVVTLQTAVLF